MVDLSPANVDLIRELRLRRWARANHVPAEQRDEEWHPVVLEEMRIVDEERQQNEQKQRESRFVPLAPSRDNRRMIIHAAHSLSHQSQAAPNEQRDTVPH